MKKPAATISNLPSLSKSATSKKTSQIFFKISISLNFWDFVSKTKATNSTSVEPKIGLCDLSRSINILKFSNHY